MSVAFDTITSLPVLVAAGVTVGVLGMVAGAARSVSFRIGMQVLKTTVVGDAGTVLAQLGNADGHAIAESDAAEWFQQQGLFSRPPVQQSKKAGVETVTLSRGDRDVVIATRNLNAQKLAGLIKDGETCLYADGDGDAQGRVLIKKNGAVTLLTTADNAPGGATVFLRLAPDGLQFAAPWGTLRFDATGFHVVHASGARVDLGGIGGIPGLGSVGSYVSIDAATAKVHGGTVLIGPKSSAYQPVCFVPFEGPASPANPVGVLSGAPGSPLGVFSSGSVRIAK